MDSTIFSVPGGAPAVVEGAALIAGVVGAIILAPGIKGGTPRPPPGRVGMPAPVNMFRPANPPPNPPVNPPTPAQTNEESPPEKRREDVRKAKGKRTRHHWDAHGIARV